MMKIANRKVPGIRFKSFEEEWKEMPLRNLTSLITKGTTPLNKSSDGNINFVKIESINPVNGLIESTSKITEDEHLGYLKRSQLKANDILFSIAGTLGRVTIVPADILPANTNQALAIIRLKDSSHTFISTFLKGRAITNFVRKNPTVGAQPNLSLLQISNFNIAIPSTTEQTQIGNYFKEFDNLIQLQEHKLKKVTNLKKAMLEKMFPKEDADVPKIRFKGFTEAWKKKKLGQIGDIVGGGTPSTSNKEFWDGSIDWYSPTEIGDKVYATGSQRRITQLGLQMSSATILPANRTVLFTSRAGIGDMAILKKPGATNQGFQSLVLNNEYDTYFVYSMGFLIRKYAIKLASGSTFLEISGKTLKKMPITVPTPSEQALIGNYFKSLDDLIELSRQKIEQLKHLKQALLQRMFI